MTAGAGGDGVSSAQIQNCETYNFPTYYDGQNHGQQNHSHHLAHTHSQQQHHPPTNASANFINGSIHPGFAVGSASNVPGLENSDSSSDFNFLSNLANDFAPEYYQLS